MVSMGTIWDRTQEVLRGRAGILLSIAALTIYLPAVVNAGVQAYTLGSPLAALTGITGLVSGVLTIWGTLALIAVASDPATDAAAAYGRAGPRVLPAIGVILLLVLAVAVLAVPLIAILAASGLDFAAIARGASPGTPSGGMVGLAALYVLVLVVVGIWVSARLALLYPVVLHERLGLGAIGRTWSLTRGLALKIIGVLLLFGIVLGIAAIAVQLIAGVVFRLIVGADQIATTTLLTALLTTVVTALGTVVQSTFTAQLYVALTGREAAAAFE
jgi:hypothetical protein